MPQVPAVHVAEGSLIPYPGANRLNPGDVVLLGTIPTIAASNDPNLPIADQQLHVEGIFDVPKDASVFAAGDPVYWAAAGNPVGGTAGTGAATSTSAGGHMMGFAIAPRATGLASVRVFLQPGGGVVALAASSGREAGRGEPDVPEHKGRR